MPTPTAIATQPSRAQLDAHTARLSHSMINLAILVNGASPTLCPPASSDEKQKLSRIIILVSKLVVTAAACRGELHCPDVRRCWWRCGWRWQRNNHKTKLSCILSTATLTGRLEEHLPQNDNILLMVRLKQNIQMPW